MGLGKPAHVALKSDVDATQIGTHRLSVSAALASLNPHACLAVEGVAKGNRSTKPGRRDRGGSEVPSMKGAYRPVLSSVLVGIERGLSSRGDEL